MGIHASTTRGIELPMLCSNLTRFGSRLVVVAMVVGTFFLQGCGGDLTSSGDACNAGKPPTPHAADATAPAPPSSSDQAAITKNPPAFDPLKESYAARKLRSGKVRDLLSMPLETKVMAHQLPHSYKDRWVIVRASRSNGKPFPDDVRFAVNIFVFLVPPDERKKPADEAVKSVEMEILWNGYDVSSVGHSRRTGSGASFAGGRRQLPEQMWHRRLAPGASISTMLFGDETFHRVDNPDSYSVTTWAYEFEREAAKKGEFASVLCVNILYWPPEANLLVVTCSAFVPWLKPTMRAFWCPEDLFRIWGSEILFVIDDQKPDAEAEKSGPQNQNPTPGD